MKVHGIVAEHDGEVITFLTPEGDLYILPAKDYPAKTRLGQVFELNIRRRKEWLGLTLRHWWFAATAVAAAIVFALIFWNSRLAAVPVLATVAIDINPSIEIDVAKETYHPVVAVRAINADGKHLLRILRDGGSPLNKERPLITDVTAAVTAAAGRAGFVEPNRGLVLVTVIPRSSHSPLGSLQQAALTGARNGLMEAGILVPVVALTATPSEAAAARQAGLPAGIAAVMRAAAMEGVKLDEVVIKKEGLAAALRKAGLSISSLGMSSQLAATQEQRGAALSQPALRESPEQVPPHQPEVAPSTGLSNDSAAPKPKTSATAAVPNPVPAPESVPKVQQPTILTPLPPAGQPQLPSLPNSSTLLPELPNPLPPGDLKNVAPEVPELPPLSNNTNNLVPEPEPVPLPIPEPALPPVLQPESLPQPETTPPPGYISYVVQPGDTLYQIAQKFDVSVDQLLAANVGIDPLLLPAGLTIKIPVTSP